MKKLVSVVFAVALTCGVAGVAVPAYAGGIHLTGGVHLDNVTTTAGGVHLHRR